MKVKKLLIFIVLLALFSGCASKKSPRKRSITHPQLNNYQNSYPRAAYSPNLNYPPQQPLAPRGVTPASASYPMAPYQPRNTYSYSARPKVARSMQELDRLSAQTKPHYVVSLPRATVNNDINLLNLEPIKYKMINYVNSIRANGGYCNPPAPPLGWSRELASAATSHAKDMAVNNFLGHLGSGTMYDVARKAPGAGSNFYERIIASGYPIRSGELAGEILTYTKDSTVGSQDAYEHFVHAIQNFLKSPQHCSVLTNPRFRDMGIAGYRGENKTYWVINFGELNY